MMRHVHHSLFVCFSVCVRSLMDNIVRLLIWVHLLHRMYVDVVFVTSAHSLLF